MICMKTMWINKLSFVIITKSSYKRETLGDFLLFLLFKMKLSVVLILVGTVYAKHEEYEGYLCNVFYQPALGPRDGSWPVLLMY
jgi:hypothetical protein